MDKCPVCQNTLCDCKKGKKILVGEEITIPGITIPLLVKSMETFWYYDKKSDRLYVGKAYNIISE